jgi:hypothetical protein
LGKRLSFCYKLMGGRNSKAILGSLDAFLDSFWTLFLPLFFSSFSHHRKMVMSCFFPTTTCMMHSSPLLSHLGFDCPQGQHRWARSLCHGGPPMDQEEDWCGWGVPFKNTVFVATACVCVWYICMHQHHPCTTLISWAAQLFHLWQDRSKEESLDAIEFDHGIMCRIFFSELLMLRAVCVLDSIQLLSEFLQTVCMANFFSSTSSEYYSSTITRDQTNTHLRNPTFFLKHMNWKEKHKIRAAQDLRS